MKISEFFLGKSIVVTGGTGLIGRFVVKQLCDFGSNVTVVSLDKFKVDDRANHIFGDLTDFNFCLDITKNIDYAFHLSGIKGSIKVTKEKPASFFVPLLMMNTNFLEASRKNNIKRLVYTSSIGAYSSREIFKEEDCNLSDEPMDLYPGWAKRMAELQIISYKKQYNLENYFIVRPCNVYGPGDNFDEKNAMVIPTIFSRIFKKEDPVIIWGDGSAIRDFAYAEDVAQGVIQTMVYGTGDLNFLNLGSGQEYSIKNLIETMSTFIKFNYEFDITKDNGFKRRVMDITNAKKIIGYNPNTSLKHGLEKTWNWFVNNYDKTLLRKNYFNE